jgi:hypothetical protein
MKPNFGYHAIRERGKERVGKKKEHSQKKKSWYVIL